MIIHCTQKLAAKLPQVSTTPLTETNPLGSWHANLYTIDRRNCVMFCHDHTRFVLFMAGLTKEHFANLDFWFQDLFANTLLKSGYDTDLIEKALALLTPCQFDTCCNRSVQGSMRTVMMQDVYAVLYDCANVMELSPYSTAARINDRPVTIKGMKFGQCLWPDREMKDWLERVTGAGLH